MIEKDRTWPASLHHDAQCGRRRRCPGGRRRRPKRPWSRPRGRGLAGLGHLGGRPRRAGPDPPARLDDRPGHRGPTVEGQAIVFRTKAPDGVVVTKTFRLGKNIDGLEVELQFDSPDKERKVVYNLRGPHGIPIEGEWYTGTFRDLFFGQLDQDRIKVRRRYSANDVAKAGDKPIENTALPLRVCGRGEPVLRHPDGARPVPDRTGRPMG